MLPWSQHDNHPVLLLKERLEPGVPDPRAVEPSAEDGGKLTREKEP